MENFQELDALAIEHLRFQAELLTSNDDNISDDARVARSLACIESMMLAGLVDDVITLCSNVCGTVLADPALQMQLRLHKLVELLHIANTISSHDTSEYQRAIDNSVKYANELALFALDAFPEAYSEFTEAMLLFAFPERTADPHILQQRRKSLARQLVSLSRAALGSRESTLSRLVKYMLIIHVNFRRSQSGTPAVQAPQDVENIIDDLLRVQDDDGARELSFSDAFLNFKKEAAILTAPGIAWNDDVSQQDAKKHVHNANRTEQCQVPTKTRGLGPLPKLWSTNGVCPTCPFSKRHDFPEADVQTLLMRVDISRQDAVESLRFTNGDVLAAFRNELGRICLNTARLQALVEDYCAHRGLQELEPMSLYRNDAKQKLEEAGSKLAQLSPALRDTYATMRQVRELAESGNMEDLVQTALKIDPQLLERSPVLTFRILEGRLLRLLRDGDYEGAVNIARKEMGPLADQNSELLECLKESTMLLAFPGIVRLQSEVMNSPKSGTSLEKASSDRPADAPKRPRLGTIGPDALHSPCTDIDASPDYALDCVVNSIEKRSSIQALAGQVYRALGDKLGEPSLVKLLRATLRTHAAWLDHNQMKDIFAEHVRISAIGCQSDVLLLQTVQTGKEDDENRQAGSQAPSASLRRGGGMSASAREDTVLLLMEFLALSRSDALEILQHHGNASNPHEILEAFLGAAT